MWAALTDSYTGLPMAITAENLAEQYQISREEPYVQYSMIPLFFTQGKCNFGEVKFFIMFYFLFGK